MSQSIPGKDNPNNGINQKAENSTLGRGTQSIQGDNNTQQQNNINQILNNVQVDGNLTVGNITQINQTTNNSNNTPKATGLFQKISSSNLSGQQRQRLQEALMSAFPDKKSLEQILSFQLDEIALGDNLKEVVFKLIKKAEAENWIEDLIASARRKNSRNSKLGTIAEELLANNERNMLWFSEQSQLGKLKSEDQKYDGSLVRIQLNFFNYSQQNQKLTDLLLDISFGEVEENYIGLDRLGFGRQERHIRFGIKFGELCLNFTNKYMLFNSIWDPEAEKIRGLATSVGTSKTPKWQFKANKLETENDTVVLFGTLREQKLGTINFSNSLCEVEATFQVSGVNSNNLGITDQDGLWDAKTSKKVKETKIRAFFKKVVEPKLKDYVSKVVLQYDSAVVS